MYERSDAAIYDAMNRGAGKDYGAEAAAVTEAVLARRPEARTLLDVACGTGEHLSHLRHRFEVEGLELSEHMAAIARTKLGPDVPIHAGDMRSFDLGRTFDAVTCMFSSIGYARDAAAARPGDRRHGPAPRARRRARLRRVAAARAVARRPPPGLRRERGGPGPHPARHQPPARAAPACSTSTSRWPPATASTASPSGTSSTMHTAEEYEAALAAAGLRGRAGARPPGRPLALRGRPVRLSG